MGFEAYHSLSNISALKVIGDVKIALNGCVEESCMKEEVLNQLKFALGAGSFGECSCVGETIVLNQTGYTCYVDHLSELVTRKGQTGLRSPFLMGLKPGCHPSTLLQVDYPNGIVLNELLESMGENLQAYAYVGCLLFENLACSYLKKPPIFKENISENVEKYWAKTEEHSECYTYLFGVVIKEKGKHSFPAEMLQKAFYVNPLEEGKSGAILSHTHAALVKTPPSFSHLKKDFRFYEQLEVESIIGIRHIFTQSIVKEGLLALFNIKEIT